MEEATSGETRMQTLSYHKISAFSVTNLIEQWNLSLSFVPRLGVKTLHGDDKIAAVSNILGPCIDIIPYISTPSKAHKHDNSF